MKCIYKNLILVICCLTVVLLKSTAQVTPNALPETKALLDLYKSLTGKYTLTGQHNYPNTKCWNTQFYREFTGKTPVIWSCDFGFSAKDDKDSFLSRPDIVKEAIRQHKKGSIITICWHAVPPTANEPVTFQPKPGSNPEKLESVQGRLTEAQYEELLTPGSELNKHWSAQVDTIAHYLKWLEDAHVPVLWRPYHEMNGDWFWWGGRVGKNTTADIYRLLFDRLVNVHHLKNLIWLWNVDRPSQPIRKFSNFYPGNEYLDIVSLDVYGSDFNQAYYDSLIYLAKGKPVLLGEVGNPPALDVFKNQPNWTSWVIWAGMTRNTTKKEYAEMFKSPRMLNLEDKAYQEISANYRKVCGLPVLPLKPLYNVNFTGDWKLNSELSELKDANFSELAQSIKILQDDDIFLVKKFIEGEWGDDRLFIEDFYTNAQPVTTYSNFGEKSVISAFDSKKEQITRNTISKFSRNGQTFNGKTTETWELSKDKKQLIIEISGSNNRGKEAKLRLVYDKI